MFIQTEPTPNPQSLKFLPGKPVLLEEHGSSVDFPAGSELLRNSPLARKLFDIQGCIRVFFGKEFISVTKNDDVEWEQMKPQIFATIMDFYAAGESALSPEEEIDSLAIQDDDSEVV